MRRNDPISHPMTTPTFQLSESQQRVVDHRGSHLQVIACAGSGKTESVSRRVATLIEEGVEPASIVAFTFTEKAAAELKARIIMRVRERMGEELLGRIGPMFVGTIHAYAFRILQDYVPRYGNYDVLDEHRHAGLLSREYWALGLKDLGRRGQWKSIQLFIRNADVVGNELIDRAEIAGTPFGKCYEAYEEMLDRYHLLTFQQLISRAVEALQDPAIFRRVHDPLRYVLVDEYQDVNPAQERLISLLATAPVELCVVGDDDQAIYEWRGSDVGNILGFRDRYPGRQRIDLATNRRSRPSIITTANAVITQLDERLAKSMKSTRQRAAPEVVRWAAVTEAAEAAEIANAVGQLVESGYHYSDIGILYRSVRTSSGPLLDALDAVGIPYACGGRTGLFLQPEPALFGEIFAWIAGRQWKDRRFGPFRDPDIEAVAKGLSGLFPAAPSADLLVKFFKDWRRVRLRGAHPVSLVGDFYRFLEFLRASDIDVDTPQGSARFGGLARFSNILGDFEHVNRRSRWIEENGDRRWRTGRNRGKRYFEALANYLVHYAHDAYEDFDGESADSVDAVSVMTVHQAKGLEWPVVFMPALVKRRFPSSMSGRQQDWLLDDDVFPRAKKRRYEGSIEEERRLFYVALTRARDCVYLSRFERKKQRFSPSPFLRGLNTEARPGDLPLPPPPSTPTEYDPPELMLSFSDVALYSECGYRYRLAVLFGYQPELAVELGYGRAIHHVIRRVAETSMDNGVIPGETEVGELLDDELYLPYADIAGFERMSKAVGRTVRRYVEEYTDDLQRVWAVERPFELQLSDGTVAGRADVILDEEDGQIGSLAIVDYKVATDSERDSRYRKQLAIYASAGRSEGLEVAASYLHDLSDGTRRAVDVSPPISRQEVNAVARSVSRIRRGDFPPNPSTGNCQRCDYRVVCRFAAV